MIYISAMRLISPAALAILAVASALAQSPRTSAQNATTLSGQGSASERPRFSFNDGDRVVFLGDTMMEREQRYGYIETILTARLPFETSPGAPTPSWANPAPASTRRKKASTASKNNW
jgi:hypothetical protein